MSNPIITWSADSANLLHVTVTGNLTPDAAGTKGSIWSGDAGSPSGRWRINVDPSCTVSKTVNPTLPFDLHMGNVVVFQNYGPVKDLSIYASGFGISSWLPVPLPPQYTPYVSGWKFQFESNVAGGTVPPGWFASYLLTLFLSPTLNDLAKWHYVFEIMVKGP